MQPQVVEGRADIGEELAGMRAVPCSDSDSEKRDAPSEYLQRRMSFFFPACACGMRTGLRLVGADGAAGARLGVQAPARNRPPTVVLG